MLMYIELTISNLFWKSTNLISNPRNHLSWQKSRPTCNFAFVDSDDDDAWRSQEPVFSPARKPVSVRCVRKRGAARAPPTVDPSPWDRPLISFSRVSGKFGSRVVVWQRSERLDTEVRKSDTNCAIAWGSLRERFSENKWCTEASKLAVAKTCLPIISD